jgi:hypothetical protein
LIFCGLYVSKPFDFRRNKSIMLPKIMKPLHILLFWVAFVVFGLVGMGGCAGSGACLVPYASIPARIEVGGLSAHGSIPVSDTGSGIIETKKADMLHLKVGLNPLQGFNSLHDRNWDIGAGYLAEWLWPESGPDTIVYQGFHLEGAYFPWSGSVGTTSFRLCLLASAEVILSDFSQQAEIGPGASLGTYIEWTGTASTAYAETEGGGLGSSAGSIGALYGEWGLGAGISAGYRRLYGRDYLTVFVGMSFRLPFGIGLAGISS